MNQTNANPTTPPANPLRDNLVKKWAYLKLGDYAAREDALLKQGALNRRLVRKTQDGTLGELDDAAEEDDMGVRVGDETHYHQYAAPAPKPSPSPSTFTKAAIAAAGLAAAGAAGGYLARIPSPDPRPAIENADADTRYQLRLSTAEERDAAASNQSK